MGHLKALKMDFIAIRASKNYGSHTKWLAVVGGIIRVGGGGINSRRYNFFNYTVILFGR